MPSSPREPRDSLRLGIHVGAAVTALLLISPYVQAVVAPAYILGPIVGTWILIWHRGQSLDYSDGARVGFLSSFYGSVAAIALHHLARRAEELEIWSIENLYLLPPLLADLGLEGESVGDWYLWMAQLVILTIVAGALGAPSGVLGVKLFSKAEH